MQVHGIARVHHRHRVEPRQRDVQPRTVFGESERGRLRAVRPLVEQAQFRSADDTRRAAERHGRDAVDVRHRDERVCTVRRGHHRGRVRAADRPNAVRREIHRQRGVGERCRILHGELAARRDVDERQRRRVGRIRIRRAERRRVRRLRELSVAHQAFVGHQQPIAGERRAERKEPNLPHRLHDRARRGIDRAHGPSGFVHDVRAAVVFGKDDRAGIAVPFVREGIVRRRGRRDDMRRVRGEPPVGIEIECVDDVGRPARHEHERARRVGGIGQRGDADPELLARRAIAVDHAHRREFHHGEREATGRAGVDERVHHPFALVVVADDRKPPVRAKRHPERVHPGQHALAGRRDDPPRRKHGVVRRPAQMRSRNIAGRSGIGDDGARGKPVRGKRLRVRMTRGCGARRNGYGARQQGYGEAKECCERTEHHARTFRSPEGGSARTLPLVYLPPSRSCNSR